MWNPPNWILEFRRNEGLRVISSQLLDGEFNHCHRAGSLVVPWLWWTLGMGMSWNFSSRVQLLEISFEQAWAEPSSSELSQASLEKIEPSRAQTYIKCFFQKPVFLQVKAKFHEMVCLKHISWYFCNFCGKDVAFLKNFQDFLLKFQSKRHGLSSQSKQPLLHG